LICRRTSDVPNGKATTWGIYRDVFFFGGGGGMVFKQIKETQVTMLVLGHAEDVAKKIGQRWHKAG